MRGKIALVILSGLALVVGGCTESSDVGAAIQYAAPATHGATEVSHTIPATMAPGERRRVQVVMQNTGASSPTDDWATNTHRLISTGTFFGWPFSWVPSATAADGSSATFEFVLQAPSTPGTYTFRAQMFNNGYFGDVVSASVTVDAMEQPEWGCTYVPGSSTVPSSMTPNENASVTVAVQNSGTQSWPASGVYLYSKDSPLAQWNHVSTTTGASVAPGATALVTFAIRAPSTIGTYSFRRQMFDANSGGVGFFNNSFPCVDLSIDVTAATPALAASQVSNDFLTTMAPGDIQEVSVVVQNDGTETWANDGNYVLSSQNSPTSLWGVTSAAVTSSTVSGGQATFTFVVTAPTTPGMYEQRWQMRKLSGTGSGYFGDVLSVSVTVDAGATPQLGAQVVSQTIPSTVSAGRSAQFSITMENTGSRTWTGSDFKLYSTNSPFALWSQTVKALGAMESIAPGQQKTFTFNVVAPSTPGTYASSWRMLESKLFGDSAITSNIQVVSCGNAVLDVGEECDDGNLASGDGCSAACALESLDLGADASGRSFLGTANLKALAATVIGEVSGDAYADVMVVEHTLPFSYGVGSRSQGGVVYGHLGSASFFDDSQSVADAGAAFVVAGAEGGDKLGLYATGGMAVGDLTGDGVGDLLISASGADGEGNARPDCGEAYIIEGGTNLATAGFIDLASDPAHAQLKTTFIGKSAGDQLIALAVGELTGDSLKDVVLGAPRSSVGGADSGAIYVVARPAGGFPAVVDLANPGAVNVFEISGPAGALVGYTAAVGNFTGTSTGDLLLGSDNFDPSGRPNAGGAWGIAGPISGGVDLSSAVGGPGGPDLAWYGRRDYERLGSVVQVADMVGSISQDVLISSRNWEAPIGTQVGAVLVFEGTIASGTYDLSGGASADAVIVGIDQYDNTGGAFVLGDANNDGFDDLLVCAGAGDGPGNSRDRAGEARLVLGASSLASTLELSSYASPFIVYGAAASDLLCNYRNAVAVGDVDGDGLADWCVGAHAGGDIGGSTHPGQVECYSSHL